MTADGARHLYFSGLQEGCEVEAGAAEEAAERDRVRVTRGHQRNSVRCSWRNSATGRGGRPVICWNVPVV
jgi:hypothetical protein